MVKCPIYHSDNIGPVCTHESPHCPNCICGGSGEIDYLAALKAIVNEQAEDEALWFIHVTAPEAYLQQGLRRLHAAIEAIP